MGTGLDEKTIYLHVVIGLYHVVYSILMKIIEQKYRLHFIICVAILSQVLWQSLVLIVHSVLFCLVSGMLLAGVGKNAYTPYILWIVGEKDREHVSELGWYTLILAYLEEITLDLLKPWKQISGTIAKKATNQGKLSGSFLPLC